MKTISCIGDSITAGWSKGTYPKMLQKILDLWGSYWVYTDGGVPGEVSSATIPRVQQAVNLGFNLVILEIGTNDMFMGVPDHVLKANLTQMVQTAKSRGVQILLLGMPNWRGDPKTADHPVYAEVAREQGVPLLSDAYRNCLAQPIWQMDGVHLNDLGYQGYAYHVGQAMLMNGLM